MCPTLTDPMGCSPPGSFLCGIHQARILEWVAISFSDRTSSEQKEQPTKNDQKKKKKTTNHYEDHNFLMIKSKTGNCTELIEGVRAQLCGIDGNFSCKNPTELS